MPPGEVPKEFTYNGELHAADLRQGRGETGS